MKTHFDQSIFPTHSENWDFSHQMFFSDQWNSAPWRPPIGNRGNRGLGTPLLRSFTLFCRLRWTFKVSRQISYRVDSAPIPWGMATFCSNSPIYYIYCVVLYYRHHRNKNQFAMKHSFDLYIRRPFSSVEISGFFCHSNFTWNQFWELCSKLIICH